MTTETGTGSIFATPSMSEEHTPELALDTTPIRFSGFIALVLGLASFMAIFGEALIVVPAMAILLGAFALRRYSGDRPVGVIAAGIGVFCALMFGVWGVSERHFKKQQMSDQATRFAYEWLQLVGQGNIELALELQIHPQRRQTQSMPLTDYYERSDVGAKMMQQFREQDVVPQLIAAGDKPKWVPERPAKVYTLFGRELTQTVWRDTSGVYPRTLKIVLEYIAGRSSKVAQWKIELVSDFIDDSDRV